MISCQIVSCLLIPVTSTLPSPSFPTNFLLKNLKLQTQTTMSTSKHPKSDSNNQSGKRVVYSEFGNYENSAAIERGTPEVPPNQQTLKVEASRKGRGGKTVTIISGFQEKPETLANLAKQLKAQCGTGGTVKDNEIEIQGEHKQKLLEILKKLGYKAKVSGG